MMKIEMCSVLVFFVVMAVLGALSCVAVVIETLIFQWLLAQFGMCIGFWKALLMLLALDSLMNFLFLRLHPVNAK